MDEVSDTAIAFLMDSTRRISEYNQIMIDLKRIPQDWQSLKIHKINRSSNIKVCSIGVGRIGSSFLIKKQKLLDLKHTFMTRIKKVDTRKF